MAWQTVCPLLGGKIWNSRWDSVRITSSVLWSLLYCNGKLIKPVPNLWNSKRYECGYWQQPSRVSTSQASETTNIISSCPKNNCLCVSLLYVSRLHVCTYYQPITTAPIKLQPFYGLCSTWSKTIYKLVIFLTSGAMMYLNLRINLI